MNQLQRAAMVEKLKLLKAEYQQHQSRIEEIKVEVKELFEFLNADRPFPSEPSDPEHWC